MAAQHPHIQLKRAYSEPGRQDGCRVLVDGLWPRGIKKEALHIDAWCRDVAPSVELRRWFGHREELWPQFRERYMEELKSHADAIDDMLESAKGHSTLTLIYGARDEEHNNAVVLREYLLRHRLGRA